MFLSGFLVREVEGGGVVLAAELRDEGRVRVELFDELDGRDLAGDEGVAEDGGQEGARAGEVGAEGAVAVAGGGLAGLVCCWEKEECVDVVGWEGGH
jgi:hypothetical protein